MKKKNLKKKINKKKKKIHTAILNFKVLHISKAYITLSYKMITMTVNKVAAKSQVYFKKLVMKSL